MAAGDCFREEIWYIKSHDIKSEVDIRRKYNHVKTVLPVIDKKTGKEYFKVIFLRPYSHTKLEKYFAKKGPPETRHIKDLGYANDWRETPDIVKACQARRHVAEEKSLGRCLTEYYCEACGYRYKVDSSD